MTEGVTLEYLSAIFNVTCTALTHTLSFDGPSAVLDVSTSDLFTVELDFGQGRYISYSMVLRIIRADILRVA